MSDKKTIFNYQSQYWGSIIIIPIIIFANICMVSSLNSSRLLILLYLVFKTPQMVSNIMSHWNNFKWSLQLTSPSSKWVVFKEEA